VELKGHKVLRVGCILVVGMSSWKYRDSNLKMAELYTERKKAYYPAVE
jgi:hypothetical protein